MFLTNRCAYAATCCQILVCLSLPRRLFYRRSLWDSYETY